MKRGSFAAGFLTCLLLTGVTTTAFAAGITAERSNHRIFVDGQEVQMEAYVIGGSNYVKLRDIGKQVGFNVYWANGVQVDSHAPYTGEAPAEAEPTTPKQTEHAAIDVAAAKQDIIDRTNALRRENGVAALTVNDKLMQAAQARADEMAASGVYSHTRPDGRRSNTVTDCPYTGEAAMWSWNLSEGHRDNLLEKNYAEIGVGLAKGMNASGEDCWYCVQTFLWNGYTVSWVDAPAAK